MNNIHADRDRNRLEVYNTIILGIATLAVAWCSYQNTLWSGNQTFRLAESNKYSRLAQQTLIRSGQTEAMEETLIIEFVAAAFDRNQRKTDYILKGIRPELSIILSNWLGSHPFENNAAPRHPMVMPEYKALRGKRIEESEKLTAKANEAFDEAQKANTNADRYSLLSVMFSMVMFLGAITTKLVRIQLQFTLTLISAIICIAMLALTLFYMPVAARGN